MFTRWIGWQGLVSAVLAVVLAAALWLSYGPKIERDNEKVRFLRDEIAKLDQEIGEVGRLKDVIQEILARKQTIAVLQQRRYAVELLEELSRRRPQRVYLIGVRDERRRFLVTGFAASARDAERFLANIADSALFQDVLMLEQRAEAAPQLPAYPQRFTLGMTLKARQ